MCWSAAATPVGNDAMVCVAAAAISTHEHMSVPNSQSCQRCQRCQSAKVPKCRVPRARPSGSGPSGPPCASFILLTVSAVNVLGPAEF